MSTLDNFRKQAKRWLKALRRDDPEARDRLRQAHPTAPAAAGLRDVQHALAREQGHESWKALKAAAALLQAQGPASTHVMAHHDGRVATFLEYACWDHHIHGRGDSAMAEAAALRILGRFPEIARDSLYTAVVCGEIEEVERILTAHPELVNQKGGSRRWEPLLYLCYARLPLAAPRDRSLAIARALLDRGADPNAHYMAGDAVYSALVGVAGEGEQDAPPHPQREALYQLLLERGAQPYDIQVLYNTHFHGDVLWWLRLTHDHTLKTGRQADWADPDWPMLDMGGYGSGARFLLAMAIKKNDTALAEWLLAHGANPNAAPAPAPSLSKASLYEDALRQGSREIADLLLRYGAAPRERVPDDPDAFLATCLRLDGEAARALLEKHPEYRQSPHALFAAARRDRADVVAFLLDLGTPIEVQDTRKQRALHIAAGNDARRVAALLIERGAEVDPRETQFGGTPIGYASHHDNRPMIDLLSRVSRNVWTLAYRGKVERLREVLAAEPARAREVAEGGSTPLWWLPDHEERAAEVVELLLAHGADPAFRAKDGTTAADAALKRGLDEAAALLAAAAGGRPAPAAEAATPPSLQTCEDLARDLTLAYETGDPAAMERLTAHYQRTLTWDDLRAGVWRRVRTVREAHGAAGNFGVAEARDLIAREAGFGGWEALAKSAAAGAPPPGQPYTIDARKSQITPRRNLTGRGWDTVIGVMEERGLSALDANGLMTDAVMERVAQLDHVTRLSLGGSRGLTDAGLRHLARMPQLEHLDLSEYPGGRITDRGLAVLRQLPELRSFHMAWQGGVSDAGVAHLKFCHRLESVDLMGTPTGDGAVDALRGKPALRRLKTGERVTDAALPLLHQFPASRRGRAGRPATRS